MTEKRILESNYRYESESHEEWIVSNDICVLTLLKLTIITSSETIMNYICPCCKDHYGNLKVFMKNL